MRLDEYITKNFNNIKSRNHAVKLIEKNMVLVNEIIINKKNYIVNDNDEVKIINDLEFVSRAGEKIKFANETFNIDFKNKVILDLGTSTGGFADYALQNLAKKVYCVDVGYDQLDPKIKNNPNVVNYEKTNIKDLNNSYFNEPIDIVTSDLSFISSKFMFECISKLNLNQNFNLISLIKPQFEADKHIASLKNGYIDLKYHKSIIDKVIKYANENNFKVLKIIESPIVGAKKKNIEYLMWAIKNE